MEFKKELIPTGIILPFLIAFKPVHRQGSIECCQRFYHYCAHLKILQNSGKYYLILNLFRIAARSVVIFQPPVVGHDCFQCKIRLITEYKTYMQEMIQNVSLMSVNVFPLLGVPYLPLPLFFCDDGYNEGTSKFHIKCTLCFLVMTMLDLP